MSINTWKTSFIGINIPAKVLSGSADAFNPLTLWPYANDPTDPYWSGGSNPQAYQWQVNFTIQPTTHGSNLTRIPYSFTGQDIEVGDFVAGTQDGKVVEIVSILSKSDTSLVAIVEDRLRYNTFRDPQGFGLFGTPGGVIFFEINELGFPMLDPLPGSASVNFFSDVMSRFQYMNPLINYILAQDNHGFVQGDPICFNPDGTFAIADATNISKYLGTVVFPGPGPNQFILRPSNSVIDFAPSLPGNVGDYIYPSIDGSGTLTTDSRSNRPVFLKISNAIPTYTIGSGIDPTGTDGDIIEINRVQIILQGSGSGTYTLNDAINLINAQTELTKITAVEVGAATLIASDLTNVGSAYGVIAAYLPISASINGVTVNFTTTTAGAAAYGPGVAAVQDMVQDINAANIPDIVASTDVNNNLILRDQIGAGITIVNGTNDANNNPWAGPNSIVSLPLSTPPNTTGHALKLYRDDGGPMTLVDLQGQFLNITGVISGQNGRYAIGMNIEQGLRASLTTLVANIGARDALHPLPGDQAYVIDAGNNEWAVYLWNGSAWLRYSNQRSEQTDAKTLVTSIDLATRPSGIINLGTISAGRKILNIGVDVENAQPGRVSGIINSVSVAYNPSFTAPPPSDPNLIQGAYGTQQGSLYGTEYQALISPLVDTTGDMLTNFANWTVVGATGGSYTSLFAPGAVHITAVQQVNSYGAWYLITFSQPVNQQQPGADSGSAFFYPPGTYTVPTAVTVSSPTWTSGNATFGVSYDNQTFTLSVTPLNGGSGYSQGQTLTIPGSFLGTPGQNAIVTVTGITSKLQPSTIRLGTSSNNELFMHVLDSQLSGTATYTADPNYVTTEYTEIIATINKQSGSTGTVTIKLTYV
jgi:hypothetical protein